MEKGLITLLTDFGTKDSYVGAIKGAILNINPKAYIIDITHQIPPQSIFTAAFSMFNYYNYFPKDTVHMAVIDPGVGSHRKAVIVRTEKYYLVGPNNGIFTFVYSREKVISAVEITNKDLLLPEISSTFHGRDVFAPAAAHLSMGVPMSKFGKPLTELSTVDLPKPVIGQTQITGRVIHVDRFGNAITNIGEPLFRDFTRSSSFIVELKRIRLQSIRSTYQEAREGETIALFGSAKLLEISINGGDASEQHRIVSGDTVSVHKV